MWSMTMRSSLAGVILGALLSSALAATATGVDPSVPTAGVAYKPGMMLQIFMTETKTCPPTVREATPETGYFQIYSEDSDIEVGGSQPLNSASVFYLASGWFDDGATLIRNANPIGPGGDCWVTESNHMKTVPCQRDDVEGSKFTVKRLDNASPLGPYRILVTLKNTDNMDHGTFALMSPGRGSTVFLEIGDANNIAIDDAACFYDTASGEAVIATDQFAHVPKELAGVTVPEDPVALVELSPCTADMIYTPQRLDCFVARTANTVPSVCHVIPQASECVLHLFMAFCADIPRDGDVAATAEKCLRRVGRGPCVANPVGAACWSGLFKNIEFDGGPPLAADPAPPAAAPAGPAAPPSNHRRNPRTPRPRATRATRATSRLGARQGPKGPATGPALSAPSSAPPSPFDVFKIDPNAPLKGPLFAATPFVKQLQAEDDFWIALAKELIRPDVVLATHFDEDVRQSQVALCYGLTAVVNELQGDLGTRIKRGCKSLWYLAPDLETQPSQTSSRDDKDVLDKTGAVMGELVKILKPVAGGAAGAAKALASGNYTLDIGTKFQPVAADGGFKLEWSDKLDTSHHSPRVRIWKKGKEDHVLFKSEKEVGAAILNINSNVFLNCDKVTVTAEEPADLDLACDLTSFADNFNEYSKRNASSLPGVSLPGASLPGAGSDWVVQLPSDTPATKTAPGLINDELLVLRDLRNKWWAAKNGTVYKPPFQDVAQEAARKALERLPPIGTKGVDRKDVTVTYAAANKLTNSESAAIHAWASMYQIYAPELKSGFAKIKPFEGLVRRDTALDDATEAMLMNFDQGLVSKGPKGLYEVRDLVTNVASMSLGSWRSGLVPPQPPSKIMSTSAFLNSTTAHGGNKVFIIKSTSGTYISPCAYDSNKIDAVAFLDGESGQFKLLGWEGSDANTPAVYYFLNTAKKPALAAHG